jgi:hypothetical protein
VSEAQFGIVQVLKPFPGFEDVYQGFPHSRPIVFPGILDPLAGRPGYSPDLEAGFAVPLGATIALAIPVAAAVQGNNVAVQSYEYQFHWRFRTLRDYRDPGIARRAPYHLPEQTPGAPDSLAAPGSQERVALPAMPETELVPLGNGVYEARPKRVVVAGFSAGPGDALLPTGAQGQQQQGILDPLVPAAIGFAYDPIFALVYLTVGGDELMVSVTRTGAPGSWDFNTLGADLPFSNIYGKGGTGPGTHPSYRRAGIQLTTGTRG